MVNFFVVVVDTRRDRSAFGFGKRVDAALLGVEGRCLERVQWVHTLDGKERGSVVKGTAVETLDVLMLDSL